ncbi:MULTISPECIES: hypothetical protein [unclassified Devosia]|uniref:hypothetical protein n=1 Tax=unclassified Devosia TaxID=196773 RepID=UPI001AD07273|nr:MULTISPECIES: hypothetical protein [unclassified Devosia]MBN9306402.1 hypothetical protein [Devosia sp.]
MSTEADKERLKLTANLLNALASGTILSALIAPYVAIGLGNLPANASPVNLLGLSTFGLALGVVLHLVARRQFNGLDRL